MLLFVLFVLLVTLLGGLYAMRGLLDDTVVAGHAAQRQKNVQIGDAALALATQVISSTLDGTDGSMALQVAADGASWFHVPSGAWDPPGTGTNAGFWSQCTNASASVKCPDIATLAGTALPGGYTARMVVVPTNLAPDPQSCGTTGYVASFYGVFLSVREASGMTFANLESVFKQCVLDIH